ncbi:MAG: MBL fold metallo-hydrolase [Deltaproteobacteria bacterium]|nr:MBL fold metallo-hydrolase [Deltaproteobacteria bacterium]
MILKSLVVGPLEVNCYILAPESGTKAVVIDPGDEGEKILNVLKNERLTLAAILNTHGHFDHIGANRLLKEKTGAPIMIHEKDAPLLPAAGEHARLFGMEGIPSPGADRFVMDGEVLTIGEMTFEVYHTPGHSEGGVCYRSGDLLFTGDTLFADSIGRSDLPGGSFRDLMVSIQNRILPLGDGIAIHPGHGPASTIGREKRTNPFLTDFKHPY